MHPAVQRDVIDGDAAFGEEFFEISVREPERRYQRTANMTTSGGKRNPVNAEDHCMDCATR